MKYSWEFKLECVEEYLKGRWAEKPDYSKCSTVTFHRKISEWTRLYKAHGIDGLKHSSTNKEWTAEKRFELVARVLAGESITSVAISAGIGGGQLYQWVNKYKAQGYDGLKLLKKGRQSSNPIMKEKPKKLTKSEKEELILLRRRNEYLEAENAYLKKLRALIVEKEAELSIKAKKQKSSTDSDKKDID